MATVADQFAEPLAAACVKRIYGIVGDLKATLSARCLCSAPLPNGTCRMRADHCGRALEEQTDVNPRKTANANKSR